jgi:dihydrofolate synthase/folylpolyglutamate synthase
VLAVDEPENSGLSANMAPSSGAFLERFLALHPKKIDLSLGRTLDLLRALGDPHKALPPVIHVAGTNGKGSTTAFLRAMLEASGRRVHVYTSPHLVCFHERIRLAGKLVEEDRLIAAFETCERVNAGAPITLFEITTAAAFHLFAEVPADILLLEVGLGGRFDSTNVIENPLATIITPVSMDHMDFLGNTLAKIAFEKAGILKKNAPVVVAPQADEAMDVIERQARRVGARPMARANRDYHVSEERGRLIYEDEQGLLDMPAPRLAGRHQFDNAATVIATLRLLYSDFPASAFEEGLRSVQWPARLQKLIRGALFERAPEGAELWLDGGHNPAGGLVVAQAMAGRHERDPRPFILISGGLASKDTGGFLQAFAGLAQEVLTVPIPGEHASRSADDVAAIARTQGLPATAGSSVSSALESLAARRWPIPPRILIAGSLYLAGDVLRENGTLPD